MFHKGRDVLPNAFDDRNMRGLSDFDRPHSFVANFIYELPIGKGRRFLDRGGVVLMWLIPDRRFERVSSA